MSSARPADRSAKQVPPKDPLKRHPEPPSVSRIVWAPASAQSHQGLETPFLPSESSPNAGGSLLMLPRWIWITPHARRDYPDARMMPCEKSFTGAASDSKILFGALPHSLAKTLSLPGFQLASQYPQNCQRLRARSDPLCYHRFWRIPERRIYANAPRNFLGTDYRRGLTR
jgi:hypothetical protein